MSLFVCSIDNDPDLVWYFKAVRNVIITVLYWDRLIVLALVCAFEFDPNWFVNLQSWFPWRYLIFIAIFILDISLYLPGKYPIQIIWKHLRFIINTIGRPTDDEARYCVFRYNCKWHISNCYPHMHALIMKSNCCFSLR